MTSIILKETFEIVDYFNLLPRINDVVPFAMFHGHGSRHQLFNSKSITLLVNGVYV